MHKESVVTNGQPTANQFTAIKQNDEQALKALYVENYRKVEVYILNNNGTEEEAKDIFQEAFIAVWRNIQSDKFTPQHDSSLAGYLYQVAKNKWLDHLRSGHYKKVVPLQPSQDGFSEDDEGNEQKEFYLHAVKKNFSKLGDNCQELLKRFYYQKESLRTIAAAFDWTEATAKNNKYRCLQRLREMIHK